MPLPIRRVLPSVIREGEGPPEETVAALSPADEVLFTYVRPTDEPEVNPILQSSDQIATTTPAP